MYKGRVRSYLFSLYSPHPSAGHVSGCAHLILHQPTEPRELLGILQVPQAFAVLFPLPRSLFFFCLCSHLDPKTQLWQPVSYPQARSGGFCGLHLSPLHPYFQSLLPRFLQSRILTQFISVSLKPIMGPDIDGFRSSLAG